MSVYADSISFNRAVASTSRSGLSFTWRMNLPVPSNTHSGSASSAPQAVASRYCRGVDFNKHFIIFWRRFFHLSELKNLRRSILGADNCFHRGTSRSEVGRFCCKSANQETWQPLAAPNRWSSLRSDHRLLSGNPPDCCRVRYPLFRDRLYRRIVSSL